MTAPRTTEERTEKRRLVVELNDRANADLAWLTATEELNKTTIVNRAVQVYRLIVEAQERGDAVAIGGEKVRFV